MRHRLYLCWGLALMALLSEPTPSPAIRLGLIPVMTITPAKRLELGVATYYHHRFAGRLMANQQPYNPRQLVAASNTWALGDSVLVCRSDGFRRCVAVLICDRGGFAEIPDPLGPRIIDLSRAAAQRLAMLHRGHIPVTVEEL